MVFYFGNAPIPSPVIPHHLHHPGGSEGGGGGGEDPVGGWGAGQWSGEGDPTHTCVQGKQHGRCRRGWLGRSRRGRGVELEEVGGGRWEEAGWVVGERVRGEGSRLGVRGGGAGGGVGGGGGLGGVGGVLHHQGGLGSSSMGGGYQSGRGAPAPQQLVGIEKQGEGGLDLHGGGGGGVGGGVEGIHSTRAILARFSDD